MDVMAQQPATPMDRLKAALIYVLPHHSLSRLTLWLTRRRLGKNTVIRWFARHFDVDMADALEPSLEQYEHFNAFFTRALTPDARPVCSGNEQIACPADGRISALGPIENGQLFQAKGHHYSLTALLGGNADDAARFQTGSFITVYLSPRDYHRLHMPLDGQLLHQVYVPGRLYSVAPHTVKTVPSLFARNERVIATFDTDAGRMALVLVGAINVAAIETVWSGLVTPPRGAINRTAYSDQQIHLNKGQEMGRFNMGSTIIAVFEQNLDWENALQTGSPVKMGQVIANRLPMT